MLFSMEFIITTFDFSLCTYSGIVLSLLALSLVTSCWSWLRACLVYWRVFRFSNKLNCWVVAFPCFNYFSISEIRILRSSRYMTFFDVTEFIFMLLKFVFRMWLGIHRSCKFILLFQMSVVRHGLSHWNNESESGLSEDFGEL